MNQTLGKALIALASLCMLLLVVMLGVLPAIGLITGTLVLPFGHPYLTIDDGVWSRVTSAGMLAIGLVLFRAGWKARRA